MGNAFYLCQRSTLKTIKIHDEDNENTPNDVYFEEGELGSGGFSTVLLATRHAENGDANQVAVKRINCCDTEQMKNALREVELTRKIASPFVISLISHGVAQSELNPNHKVISLIFPVYHGGNLWDFLLKMKTEKKVISFEDKFKIVEGILKGIKRCHGLNIAHCDIKTANILLKRDLKTPVIMDLGSATETTLRTVTSHHEVQILQDWASEKCTACYRAPELFHVEYPAVLNLKKCDIWSIGCCLFAINYWRGPLDAIWLRGDSLGLAVQSIEKYTKELGKFKGSDDAIFDELVKMCLVYNNAARCGIDDLLAKISIQSC